MSEEPITQTLMQRVRFRNRFVHIYGDIDNIELYRILQTKLDDLRRFIREYRNFIGLS
ncbi:MAG: DUF86 domain-containing protein [Syntrophaceae bacterium]|nr:DUF86 domain-containing protein [Syntrophaceae bacterium]